MLAALALSLGTARPTVGEASLLTQTIRELPDRIVVVGRGQPGRRPGPGVPPRGPA
ncbi:MAG TPA: hypothetical protein VIJ07_26385 [Dermatophilaceae bacterium]